MVDNLPTSKQGFVDTLELFRMAKAKYDAARKEVDIRCLAESDIIGMTTSGLAKNLDLLKRVGIKVVLVEEAGEVLGAYNDFVDLTEGNVQLRPFTLAFANWYCCRGSYTDGFASIYRARHSHW